MQSGRSNFDDKPEQLCDAGVGRDFRVSVFGYPVEPRDVQGRMDWALRCLQHPPQDCIVMGAVLAIRSLVGSFFYPDRQNTPPQTVQQMATTLAELADRIAGEVAPMNRAYVVAGVHSTVRILSIFGFSDDVRIPEATFQHVLDDLDHAVLLTDELSATMRRRSIAAREAAGLRSLQSVTYRSPSGSVH